MENFIVLQSYLVTEAGSPHKISIYSYSIPFDGKKNKPKNSFWKLRKYVYRNITLHLTTWSFTLLCYVTDYEFHIFVWKKSSFDKKNFYINKQNYKLLLKLSIEGF